MVGKGAMAKKDSGISRNQITLEQDPRGDGKPEEAQRLFCFNLLHLCDPIAKPHGLEFKQTLKAFTEQDEKLASWIIDHLKAKLQRSMQIAAANWASSAAELRRLSGLQRVRGTVRELVNAHRDFLLAAK